MKINKLTIYLSVILMPFSSMATPKQCDINEPGLGRVMNELSNLLSSTNPKTASTAEEKVLNSYTTSAGEPTTKPLHAGAPKPIVLRKIDDPQPILIPTPQGGYVSPKQLISDPKLSAESKRVFRSVPSGTGSPNIGPKGDVTINRGKFDSGYVDIPEKPDELTPEKPKPSFEISMQNVSTTETEINILDKALNALLAGQYEGSIALYKSIIDKQPKNKDALFGLATAYHKSGQRSQARMAYTSLLNAYPTYQEGLNNFIVLASEEAPRDALRELDQLSERTPNFAAVYAQKAVIHSNLGENDKAVDNFVKALRLSPENVTYRYNLAALYDKMGDNNNAAKLYSEILENNYRSRSLPVSRKQLTERLAYISSRTSTAN